MKMNTDAFLDERTINARTKEVKYALCPTGINHIELLIHPQVGQLTINLFWLWYNDE